VILTIAGFVCFISSLDGAGDTPTSSGRDRESLRQRMWESLGRGDVRDAFGARVEAQYGCNEPRTSQEHEPSCSDV
jgi:hypothetical protein